MPSWLEWGFWLSPLSYGEIGLSLNKFLAPRWEKVTFGCSNHNNCSKGVVVGIVLYYSDSSECWIPYVSNTGMF